MKDLLRLSLGITIQRTSFHPAHVMSKGMRGVFLYCLSVYLHLPYKPARLPAYLKKTDFVYHLPSTILSPRYIPPLLSFPNLNLKHNLIQLNRPFQQNEQIHIYIYCTYVPNYLFTHPSIYQISIHRFPTRNFRIHPPPPPPHKHNDDEKAPGWI